MSGINFSAETGKTIKNKRLVFFRKQMFNLSLKLIMMMKVRYFFQILMLILFIGCTKSEAEIIVVPENFEGRITVVLNQKNGMPIKYHGDSRVYKISSTGILKTQFTENGGWSVPPKFYYSKIKESNRIPFSIYKEIPFDAIVASGPVVGNTYKSENSKDKVSFVNFYIGNKSQIDKARGQLIRLDTLKW